MSLDGIRTRIEYVDGWSVAVIEFDERMEVLSSCFLNGGLTETSTIVIIQVHPDYSENPIDDAEHVLKALGLPTDTVCFMTAAEVYRVFTKERVNHNGFDCLALVTAGLSNQVVAGEEITDWPERKKIATARHEKIAMLHPPGTINTIGVVSEPMTDAAKVNTFIAMTEAKSAAMHDLGCHRHSMPQARQHTKLRGDGLRIRSVAGESCTLCDQEIIDQEVRLPDRHEG